MKLAIPTTKAGQYYNQDVMLESHLVLSNPFRLQCHTDPPHFSHLFPFFFFPFSFTAID